jgi:hypothetical protein
VLKTQEKGHRWIKKHRMCTPVLGFASWCNKLLVVIVIRLSPSATQDFMRQGCRFSVDVAALRACIPYNAASLVKPYATNNPAPAL